MGGWGSSDEICIYRKMVLNPLPAFVSQGTRWGKDAAGHFHLAGLSLPQHRAILC